MLALTHAPSPRIQDGQRTHIAREAINYEVAVQQHEAYCDLLRRCGVQVRTLTVNGDLPDAVFIEDTAIVLDEVAVLASMGAATRSAEPAGIEPELRNYRTVRRVTPPATIEGGDVLVVGRTLLVGISVRTNRSGLDGLHAIIRPYGYDVVAVDMRHCLHLKTACTALPDGSLIVNPAWLDTRTLRGFELVPVPAEEPWAANTLPLSAGVCMAAAHVMTAEMLRGRGLAVETVDLSEFARAEGGITCLSVLLR
jgi:dimethylargininase